MNQCSKCNNELIAGAHFCNICGTPVAGIPATSSASDAQVGLKRTIQPEFRRIRPPRASQTATGSLVPGTVPVETDTPDKPVEDAGNDVPEKSEMQDQKQSAPRPAKSPVIPKTTIEYTSIKAGQGGEKRQPAPPEDTPAMTDEAKEGEEVPTTELPDLPASTSRVAPVVESPAQVKVAPPVTVSEPDQTVPLPAPPDKTMPQPSPNAGTNRAPGIIRPIVSSASLRRNTPIPPGYTPPDTLSPLPAVPNTPPVSAEKPRQAENARFPGPVHIPAPGSPSQDTSRKTGGPQSMPVPPRHQSQPSLTNNPARQQNSFNADAPQLPQTPQPSLHDVPTNYLERPHANGNGANNTAARQELPLFSPESFAYTSKAAQHWRTSWRDLQNAEAGPAEDVSKGQAEVAAPLANRKDSFLRMRAIRSKQNAEGGERSFGFWVTLFLMICLIGGLAGYIVYSYLPSTSVAVRLSQPAPQPTFSVGGGAGQAVISRGQSLHAQGNYFGAHDFIHFLLDSTKQIAASTGSPLSVQTDSNGSFDVTILAGKDWAIGTHIISATDTQAKLTAYLDIQVIPTGSPATGNNNTDLSFTLNGQSIDQLTFTAQLGQSAPPAQRFTFTNISGAPLQWSAAASTNQNLNWLSILDSDFAGQLNISQPHTMGIGVDPTGLSSTGTYNGKIMFTINSTTQLTLGVQLTIVNAAPEMVFSPNPLLAIGNSNGTCQPGATLTFINLGSSVISWTAKADLLNNIWFVDNKGQRVQQGTLLPSGSNADTFVVTLQCSGVKVGVQYTVHVYANGIASTEIVQIVAP